MELLLSADPEPADLNLAALLIDELRVDGVDLPGDVRPDRAEPTDQIDYTGDYSRDAALDLQQIKKDLSEVDRQRKQAQRVVAASRNVDYTIQIVFLDNNQRDVFLEASGWGRYGRRYINGLALAAALGIELPESSYRPPKSRIDKVWAKFAMEG